MVYLLTTKLLNLFLIVITEIIKPQAVLFGINNPTQFCLQASALGSVQQALKDGALDSLSVVNALSGHLPQPFPSGRVLGVYVIGDQNKHSSSLP